MSRNRRRVVITGLGTVNPLGLNVKEFWKNCVPGVSGVRRIRDFFIPDHMSRIAGIVRNFSFDPGSEEEEIGALDRSLAFAIRAVKEAFSDAGLAEVTPFLNKKRCRVHLATAIAQIQKMVSEFERQNFSGRSGAAAERTRNSFLFNSISGEISKRFGLQGGSSTIVTGCTGGVDSIIFATQMIRNDKADLVVAGATEAPITPLVIAAFSQIHALSTRNDDPVRASRPFDRDRDGFVLGEGCGVLVLEALDNALARGASIYAEIAGIGSNNNCTHMTDIPQDGMDIARSCEAAIKDAGISRSEIDFINCHGSSTVQNDVAESNAYNALFGETVLTIPATSIKSQVGHALSAANSIELISSVLSIRDAVIPPTINLESQDERCNLAVVGNRALARPVHCVLKTSSGFSGLHSSLLIKKYTRERNNV